jgi:P-type Cu+ transporter
VEELDPQKNTCDLCGLRLARGKVEQTIDGEVLRFCCSGCMHVFEILYSHPHGRPSHFKETDLYRACVAAGIIPRAQGEVDQEEKGTQSKGDVIPPSETFEESLSQEISIRVEGMWCVACSLLVEEFLRKVKGVLQAQVLFLADLAVIRYLPHLVKPSEILNRISSFGYGASLFQEEGRRLEEKKALLLRLGLSAILTMNIMMISFSLYFGFFQDLGEQAIGYLSYPLFLMASLVLFYGGFPILKRAYLDFRHHHASMDTLIAIGSLSAYGYSLVQMSKGSIHLYFDTAAMLITLVLLGRYLEMGAKEKVTKEITELYTFSKQKARLVVKGTEQWVSLEALEKGEEFLVKEGERIPADASILLGEAVLDESFLTGESRPLKRSAGEEVMAGALLLKGDLLLKANSAGREGSIARMITIMQEALMKKTLWSFWQTELQDDLCPPCSLWLPAQSLLSFFRVHLPMSQSSGR